MHFRSIALTLAASAAFIVPAAAADFAAPTGEYTSEDDHRYITFSYWHQGLSRPHVRWNDWDGALNWNAENPAASSISVTIDASSVDSGVKKFDEHLVSSDFFDVANHPSISFTSTGVEKTGDDTGVVTGDLTIKGVTKSVALDVKYNTSAHDTRGGVYKIGFSGTTQIKRSDFDLGLYVPFVGDEIDITIEAEFQKSAQ